MTNEQTTTGRQLTAQDTRTALHEHAARRAAEARAAYGPVIDYATVLRMLDDRAVVRYPTTIAFDASPLEPGEFAHAERNQDGAEAGYCLCVHPTFKHREDVLPLLIAYHLVRINYGDVATHEDAEVFGAALLGMEVDDYYERLCTLADAISASQ
jgi:hypothetical protein